MSAPLVLAMVGTDHHPFDRMVAWVDAWAAEHPDVRCFVQYGTSTPPAVAEGSSMVDRDRLQELMAQAAVVVSHGGPSTIVESLRLGRRPVVVPRSPTGGEHVDGHQERFAAFVRDRGLVDLAGSAEELGALLDAALAAGGAHSDVALPDPAEAAYRLGAIAEEWARRPAMRLRALRWLAARAG